MHRISVALAAGAVTALLACQPALAYVSRTATGSAAASVVSGHPLTVTGPAVTFGNNAKPTDPPVPVTATVTNADSFHRWAHTVTVTFLQSNKTGCPAGAYRISGSPVTVNRAVPNRGAIPVVGVSVALVTAGCKGSTVTLGYAVT